MKKLYFVYGGVYILLLLVSATQKNEKIVSVTNSSLPNTMLTGAPGEGNCTQCHTGSPLLPGSTVYLNYSDVNDNYQPDSIYTFEIGVNSGVKNGFQLTILDIYGNKAGDLTAGSNSYVELAAGREYISHSASVGINSFSFQWQAPFYNMGDLFVYYSFNKSDNSGDTSGDKIYVGQKLIMPNTLAVDEFSVEKQIRYYLISHTLFVEFYLNKNANVKLSAYSIKGNLVFNKDFGLHHAGLHKINYDLSQSISLENINTLIVLLHVNDSFFQKKIITSF